MGLRPPALPMTAGLRVVVGCPRAVRPRRGRGPDIASICLVAAVAGVHLVRVGRDLGRGSAVEVLAAGAAIRVPPSTCAWVCALEVRQGEVGGPVHPESGPEHREEGQVLVDE